jgi:CBS domain-containing protein/ribosome-associated translation inhibitor RaiA
MQVGDVLDQEFEVPRAQLDTPISAVISQSLGSHEPIFVYQDKKYMGAVWPYKLLFVDRPALQDKVGSFVVNTTYLQPEDDVSRAMEQMIAQRLYTLPIFKDEKIVGVVRIRAILKQLLADRDLTERMWERLEIPKLLKAGGLEKVRDVYTQMRQENISRVIIVNTEGKLEGIVGRRDIYLALMVPPRGKQRYGALDGGYKSLTFDEDWITKLDYPLLHLYHAQVTTASSTMPKREVLDKLITGEVPSVVLVDGNNKPQGILSMRPFLKAFWKADREEIVPVEVSDRKQALDAFRYREVYDLLSEACQKWRHQYSIQKLVAVWDTSRNATGQPKLYTLDLQLVGDGDTVRAQSESPDTRVAIRDGLEKLRKQLRRNHA